LNKKTKEEKMLIYEDIQSLTKQIMRYAGNGYKYIQVSKIPEEKMKKVSKIEEKIRRRYNTNLTTYQRQYKRRQNKANFVALRYKKTIIVLKTDGETEIEENFQNIFGSVLSFDYLKIVLFRDERNKMTFRLEREILRDIKTKIKLTIKNRRGRSFHSEIRRLYTLSKVLPYRGINRQISAILKMIKEEQKKHGTAWEVPKFF
jgi:hypothetical protein